MDSIPYVIGWLAVIGGFLGVCSGAPNALGLGACGAIVLGIAYAGGYSL